MASRTTPTRTGSRFAALDPDTFGDPNATPRPSGSGKQRQQGDENEEESPSPTPASTRPPSPTATLFPAFSFHEYHWNGHVFDSLEEAITASAQGHNIPQAISSWVINVVKDLARQEIMHVYNLLGNKIYEHANTSAKDIHDIKVDIRDMKKKTEQNFQTLEEVTFTTIEKWATKAQAMEQDVDIGKADAFQLNENHKVLVETIKKLTARVTALENKPAPAPPRFATPGTTTTTATASPSRPKIAEPPKYKGTKGDKDAITLEQWLQKFGVWTRWNAINDDEMKIITISVADRARPM